MKITKYLPKIIREKVQLYKLGYNLLTKKEHFLHETGYTKSFLQKKPINKNGEFLPWMNYAIINFLQERLHKNISIFEFGSGFSSVFYAQKAKQVFSVEYNKEWKQKVEELFVENQLNNSTVFYCEVNENYTKAIEKFLPKNKFELIIVDGRQRVNCAKESFTYLAENGVLLLDDSSREKYKEIFTFYQNKGFKQITFCGIKPTGFKNDCSTVFYRENNCLGI